MKFELCIPSRCTANLPDDLEKPIYIAEEKLDGGRYVLYLGGDPYERNRDTTLLSRRTSVIDHKHVDKTYNVPHITRSYAGLEGTVLDGEIMAADFLSTNSIMNSGPALAVQKQREIGECVYYAFDVMFFRGIDVRTKPLRERRKILEAVIAKMGNPFIKAIPQVTSNLTEYFNEIVGRGGEGVIIKRLDSSYGVGWSKYKKSSDVSCIISGFKEGNGKYKNGVGSIAVSVYHDDILVEVGFASGFDDKTRADMSINPNKYLGRVVDIFCQEVLSPKNKSFRLRHPTFHRFRDDVNPEDCTKEKLLNDLKTFKGERKKHGFSA